MNASRTLIKVQVASAVYDYFAAGIFAFPIVAAWHLGGNIRFVHELLGSAGGFPEFEPFHLLFLNMFGGFTIMWSTLRIVWREKPLLGLCDGLLRYYFAFLMLTYVFYWETSAMLLVFVASELIWGTALIWLFLAQRKE